MAEAAAVIGWDLGGAHLKAARLAASGRIDTVLQVPCPLWLGLDRLEDAMDSALARLGPAGRHAVTMTGEMADLFPSREDGVRRLIAAAAARLPGAEVFVYAGRAGLLPPEAAVKETARVASANWLASAAFAAGRLDEGLFVDIGSTTTDIVPLRGGHVLAQGWSDEQRLACDELVYTGLVRTPVMAVARSVPFEGRDQGLVAELFATMADAHRLNGTLPEDADQAPAADGGGKTAEDSARRLARMAGCDAESRPLSAWRDLAACLVDHQLETVAGACRRVLARGDLSAAAPLVGAGAGRALVEKLAGGLSRDYVDFTALIEAEPGASHWAATCAPAAAVAWLAARA